ncbi:MULTISPECIES: hypothetical protein [Saccharibacillus]|uniref:hypothetical protein n=1 Tax=Saccharibacillus TaxID=456492 RepID=UPI00123A7366|nr:hypothetical protein [Saccharibacillus sp. WB 17]MWJ33062.1 hypothetical protein [Saccharibacillus sp. WB 17]
MGMESFYIKIRFDSHKPEFETFSSIRTFFARLGFECVKDKQHLILDRKLFLNVFHNELQTELSLEGCFSWYEECMEYMYSILMKMTEAEHEFEVV